MRIVGLTGAKRSGKDTVGQWLEAHHGFTAYSLAEPIKQMLVELDPMVNGPTSVYRVLKAHDFSWEEAVSDRIHGAEISHLLAALRDKALKNAFPEDTFDEDAVHDMLLQLDPRLGGDKVLGDIAGGIEDIEALKEHRIFGPELRQLMQRLGTDVMRDLHGADVWVNHLAGRISHEDVVVTDVRFDNEAAWVRRSGDLYLIDRENLSQGFGSGHVSESGVDPRYVTGVVFNNGTRLHELYEQAATVMGLATETEAA